MEADETLGILQTSPRLIGGVTPLGRVQQFAARIYGPVLIRGLRAWFGNAGNYWGHNAMIRTKRLRRGRRAARAPRQAALRRPHPQPRLRRGRLHPPRRLRRAHGRRPRRQLRARAARTCSSSPPATGAGARATSSTPACSRTAGFHPLSRLHLFMGVMSYLASPLWLLFLLAGMSLALHAALVPPDYLPRPLLAVPRLAARSTPSAPWCSSGSACSCSTCRRSSAPRPSSASSAPAACASPPFFGLLVEILLSALVAPIMMLVQTHSVIQIVTGRDSGWDAQARDSDRVPWSILWRFHRRHMLIGVLLAVAAGAISWRLLAWMSPALVGLVLAVPLSAFMGNARVGRALARLGLLLTPEEAHPPADRRRRRPRRRRPPRPRPPARRPRGAPRRPARRSTATSPGSTSRPRARAAPPTPPSRARSSSSTTSCPSTASTPARPMPSSPRPACSRGSRAAHGREMNHL